MNNLYLINIILLLSCVSNYKDISYYDNGKKQYEIQYKNNKINGIAKAWDTNGKLINQVNYVNNKFHGQWIDYFPNGTIQHIINYNYGKKHGKEIWYYKSGNIKSQAIYEYDVIISEILRWDDNGRILNE